LHNILYGTIKSCLRKNSYTRIINEACIIFNYTCLLLFLCIFNMKSIKLRWKISWLRNYTLMDCSHF